MSIRPLSFAAAAALAVACSSATPPTMDPALNGPWTSHTLKVDVLLNLTWTADSVTGSGTYNVLNGGMGCGGGTLHGTGSVTFAAARSADTIITGHMAFDNGWSPPYRGTLSGTSIAGQFMSVDTGTCPFDLFKGLVP
jgi:hypothetical protein